MGKKRALLIGNSNYTAVSGFTKLKSCKNDVEQMEIKLKSMGFEVYVKKILIKKIWIIG